MDDFIR